MQMQKSKVLVLLGILATPTLLFVVTKSSIAHSAFQQVHISYPDGKVITQPKTRIKHSLKQIVTLHPDSTAEPEEVIYDYGLNPEKRHIYRHPSKYKKIINGRTVEIENKHVFKGFAVEMDDNTIAKLKNDPRVKAVEADSEAEPSLINIAQVKPTGIVRMLIPTFPLAHINKVSEPLNVDVAILDTGIDNTHPDLNVVQMAGFADAGYNGFDWNGHGTHVAGTVGAIDNTIGVVGVAPGARLWSVQVLGPTESSFTNVLAGIGYIASNTDKISVVNASLGPSGTNNPIASIQQAVQSVVAAGVVFVAAAGNNNGQDISGLDGVYGTPDDFIPAALPEVMAVSAMDPTNYVIASFSNSSNSYKVPNTDPRFVNSPGKGIDVCAPGVSITSTYLTSTNGYATMSGTSMASPHVAGLVALYVAANGRGHTAADVYKIRQKIVNLAWPQSQWPVSTTNDPDGNPEPMAIAPPDTNDSSKTWVPVPLITSQGFVNSQAQTQVVTPPTQPSFQLGFQSVPGYVYTVQSTTNLSTPTWNDVGSVTNNIGNSTNSVVLDSNPALPSKFYRINRSAAP